MMIFSPSRIRTTILLVVLSLALALSLPYLTDSTLLHVVIVVLVIFLSLIGLIASGVFYLLSLRRDKERLRKRAGVLFSLSLIGLVQWVSVPVFNHLTEKQTVEARRYCESLIPEIRRYQRVFGSCPDQVSDLAGSPAAPRFLRGQQILKTWHDPASPASAACKFSFRFRLPGSPPLLTHQYDSETRSWNITD